MKNKYFMHIFTHTSLFLTICITSIVETRAMELFGDKESLPIGCINIVGVDPKTLFDALFDHAVELRHQQAGSSEMARDTTGSAQQTRLNTMWSSMLSVIPTQFKIPGSFIGAPEQSKTMSYAEAAAKFSNKKERSFLRTAQHVSGQITISERLLKDEQNITITSVGGHQLDLKFKRIGGYALLPGQIHDTLYVASYNRMYGKGEAERIYNGLLKEKEITHSAKGLLTTLQRRSSKENQKASAAIVHQNESKDDEMTIHLNPSSTLRASGDRNNVKQTMDFLREGSFDIFSPRKED